MGNVNDNTDDVGNNVDDFIRNLMRKTVETLDEMEKDPDKQLEVRQQVAAGKDEGLLIIEAFSEMVQQNKPLAQDILDISNPVYMALSQASFPALIEKMGITSATLVQTLIAMALQAATWAGYRRGAEDAQMGNVLDLDGLDLETDTDLETDLETDTDEEG